MVQDLATQRTQSSPCRTKTSQVRRKGVYESFSSRRKSRSHLHREFFGIWQILWRIVLSSLNIYASPFRHKWYGWENGTQNQRRNFCCAVAIWLGRNVVGGCRGMLLLSAKWSRFYERWFGEPLKGPVIPVGWMIEYHPVSSKDQSGLHQFGKKVLLGICFRYAL